LKNKRDGIHIKCDDDAGYVQQNATAFNQPLSCWNVSSVEEKRGMFDGATSMSHENKMALYNRLYIKNK